MASPYKDIPQSDWIKVTKELIKQHPLEPAEIVDVVLGSWNSIFKSRLGVHGFKIGLDIFPKPQIMGFLLHELIPLEFSARYPTLWKGDKDLVYIPESFYSIEIKTSSNPCKIFGNRSYTQEASSSKKTKSGYYIAVNFEKCNNSNPKPNICLIRFGWLDHTDWVGQAAASGQQARIKSEAESTKLLVLYGGK